MSMFGSPPDFDFSLSSTLARNWTVVVAQGVLGLVIGLIAFLFPGPTLLSLVGLFAVFLIIDGILATVAAVRAASKNERWGFLTFEGIVGIVAGVLAMAMPGLTVLVFVGLLAAWALVSGALEASRGLQSRHGPWPLVAGARRDHFDCFWSSYDRGAEVRRRGSELVGSAPMRPFSVQAFSRSASSCVRESSAPERRGELAAPDV